MFLKATSLGVATSVAQSLVALASSAFVARALGPAGRGEIATLFLWVQLVTWLATLGLARGNTHLVGKLQDRPSLLVTLSTNALAFAVGMGLLTAVAGGWSLSPVLPSTPGWLSAAFFLIALPTDIANNLLMAMRQYGWLSVRRLLEACGAAGLLLGLWGLGELSVPNALLAFLAAQVAGLGMSLLLHHRSLRHAIPGAALWDRSLFMQSLTWGLRAHAADTPKLVYTLGPQLLVAPLLGAKAFGLYTAALAIAAIPGIVFNSAAAAIFTEFSSPGASRSLSRQGALLLLSTLLPAALLGIWLAPYAMVAVFGEQFAGAWTVVQILMGWAFLAGCGTMTQHWLYALDAPAVAAWSSVLAACVAVATALALIGPYGVTGVALASVVGAVVELGCYALVAGHFLLRRRRLEAVDRHPDV